MNDTEKVTVSRMIAIYCHSKHTTKGELCESCADLETYAHKRLENCRYGDNKPSCVNCTTHCYKKEMKETMREVMRFAGPRMLFKHPILAIKHLLKNNKKPHE